MRLLSLILFLLSFIKADSYFIEFYYKEDVTLFEKKYNIKAIKKYDKKLYLFEVPNDKITQISEYSKVKRVMPNSYKKIELR